MVRNGDVDWNEFKATSRELHEQLDFPTVTVYTYSGGYDPATGDTSWTRDGGTDATAEVIPSDASSEPTASGLDLNGGAATFRFRDDVGLTFDEVGDDNAKPSEIEWQDRLYRVVTVTDTRNGLLEVSAVEVE